MKLNYTNNIIKNKILHNKTICYEGENFPIHLKKPLLETWQKLVSENKTDSVSEKIRPLYHIYSIKQNKKHTCISLIIKCMSLTSYLLFTQGLFLLIFEISIKLHSMYSCILGHHL